MPLRRRSRRGISARPNDAPYEINSRSDVQSAVDEHKATRGCPGNSPLYEEACPCGTKILVMCATCETAVMMMVSKGRSCGHEMVYTLDDGSTVRPFEGY